MEVIMMIVVLIKVASFYRKRVWKVHGEADGHYKHSSWAKLCIGTSACIRIKWVTMHRQCNLMSIII